MYRVILFILVALVHVWSQVPVDQLRDVSSWNIKSNDPSQTMAYGALSPVLAADWHNPQIAGIAVMGVQFRKGLGLEAEYLHGAVEWNRILQNTGLGPDHEHPFKRVLFSAQWYLTNREIEKMQWIQVSKDTLIENAFPRFAKVPVKQREILALRTGALLLQGTLQKSDAPNQVMDVLDSTGAVFSNSAQWTNYRHWGMLFGISKITQIQYDLEARVAKPNGSQLRSRSVQESMRISSYADLLISPWMEYEAVALNGIHYSLSKNKDRSLSRFPVGFRLGAQSFGLVKSSRMLMLECGLYPGDPAVFANVGIGLTALTGR